MIRNELLFVRNETKKKSDKLQCASDVQTGMEILHYFILDLLGRFGPHRWMDTSHSLTHSPSLSSFRDTPVARIFLAKTEEE